MEKTRMGSDKILKSSRLKHKIEHIVDAKVKSSTWEEFNILPNDKHDILMREIPVELHLYFRVLQITQSMKDYAIDYYLNTYVS